MERRVIGFREDAAGDWVVLLDCGHERHVRHNPPWTVRAWVLTEEGRTSWLGHGMDCTACTPSPEPVASAVTRPLSSE